MEYYFVSNAAGDVAGYNLSLTEAEELVAKCILDHEEKYWPFKEENPAGWQFDMQTEFLD